MTRAPLRSLILFIPVLFAAVPSHSGPRSAEVITVDKLKDKTDPQFEKLTANAKSDKKKEAVKLAQQLFNEAVDDRNQVPADAKFRGEDVKSVGENVGKILDIVVRYQQMMALAQTSEERHAAQNFLKDNVHEVEASLPKMIVPNAGGSRGGNQSLGHELNDAGTAGKSISAFAKNSVAPNEIAPGDGHGSPAPAELKATLGEIATKAATQAHEKVEGIGGGGATPNTPASGGGTTVPGAGDSSNGGAGAGAGNNPTVGGLLGINNPNSPTDAMTDARERYRGGDISGGLSDASRAIQLGGGAEAYALRGGMQLDQKNYPQALQDANQALQLDSSNAEARTVAQFSKGRAGADGSSGTGAAASGRGASPAVPASRPAEPGASFTAASRPSGEQAAKEARSALGLNDLSGAMSSVNRALALNPNDPSLLNLRASIYARMGQYAKAAADAKAGLANAPKNAALMRTLTYSQLRGKDYKDALAGANALIELDPKDAYGYALRGHAYGSLGDRDAMLADLKSAAALDPRFQATLAQVQSPSDSDILFLFPGEAAPGGAAATAAPVGGRTRKFGLIAGAAAFGGLLLAIGLLQTVLAPLKEQVSSVFTRLTRTGPSVASMGEPATAQPAPVDGLMPGLIRGQYEIARQIGQGGMGTVFEGTDRALGRRVAIKKMRDELRVNPQDRARFVIEAKTVAALHHPNIVDIYAIAEEGTDVYLIFEYVDGKTAHDLVQHAGRLPIAEAARIVRASADALGYAHSRGVVHRDMKPSNVMIDAAGRVKVMDFGIARMAKDSMTRYSMTNTVVGTPPYMAPEQEQGQVRRESDVYALAVCAYEMLTGKLPFVGLGAGMLMNKINMSYVAPSRATAGLPEGLDEVFRKAFQADPEKRYRTPQEFADALEAALPSAARAAA